MILNRRDMDVILYSNGPGRPGKLDARTAAAYNPPVAIAPCREELLMSQAAVFTEVGRPLELREFALPDRLAPGAALCKVLMSTICGSDLHTISGRRTEPAPLILGHEILGEIVQLGEGLTHDALGERLAIGDRVSWTIMASCGVCFFCTHELPNKCVSLRKYGHTSCEDDPPLTGGFAEHICLWPGTAIFRVPDNVPDEVATPANCALATIVCAADTIGLAEGEVVLIQGMGLLGLNLVALCRDRGAARIVVADVDAGRLALAQRFGADVCVNPADAGDEAIVAATRDLTDGRGADVAFEVCGQAPVVPVALEAMRIGGRYLIAGLVTPGTSFELDGNQITRRCATMKGIHNYAPRHLGEALRFLAGAADEAPFADIVGSCFSLDRINDAVAEAATGKHIRVAVRP